MHTRSHVSQLAKPITRLLPGVPYLSIDAAVKQLFTNGEQGAWLEPDVAAYFEARKQSYAALPGVSGAYFSTPDSTANSITGDIDIRVKVALDDWTPATTQPIIAKNDNAAQRAYAFYVSSVAPTKLRFLFSLNGSTTTVVESTVAHGISDGAVKWVRVTRDADNGAGQSVSTFYLSDDGLTWTQLGDPVLSTIGAIYNSTFLVSVGTSGSGTSDLLSGKIYRAQIYNGINGTLAVDFNPAQRATGTTWTSSTGEVWTQNGTASIAGVTGTPLLYQDAAGTTPVTAVEQPVGLILDKSKGLVLGQNLVQNGEFLDGITGWSPTAATLSIDTERLKITGTAGTATVSQSISTVTGKTYVLTGTFTAGTTSSGFLQLGTAFATISGTNTYRVQFTATGNTTSVLLQLTSASGNYAFFDNISVRELPGNHAYQSGATTLRPTVSARYNLLTYSEEFSNAVWAKTDGGSLTAVSVTANSTTAPDGTSTADTITETTDNVFHVIYTAAAARSSVTAGVAYTMSVYAKKGNGATAPDILQLTHSGANFGTSQYANFNLSTGAVTAETGSTVGYPATVTRVGTTDWYRLTFTATCTVSNTTGGVGQYAFVNNNPTAARLPTYVGATTANVYLWGASLVPADQASLPYQRVAAATDYDTVGFKPYIYFDGTDDSWVTNSIDFTGTDKMTVFAGVRKLSDAARGMFMEFSADINTNNGAFNINAPGATLATDKYGFASKGTLAGSTFDTTSTAPTTNVLTGQGDISGDSVILRVNGTQAATSTADQGTGNYGNYPLYIGRRGGTTLPFKGNLYSLIVRGAASSDAQIRAAEIYTANKTGVTIAYRNRLLEEDDYSFLLLEDIGQINQEY